MIPLTKGSKFNHQSSSEKRSQTCIIAHADSLTF